MLSLLLSLALCDDECVAPLATPPPIEGKTLKFVQVMVRHGARSPLNVLTPVSGRGFWLCDDEGSYAPRIHAAPVEHYRRFKQLLDQKLVDYPPNCKSGDLTTVGMQQHHALGELYNDYLFKNHKFFSGLPVPPEEINVRCTDVERTFRSAEGFLSGMFPTQSANEIIEIIADTEDKGTMRLNWAFCQDATDVRDKWQSSDEFRAWRDANWEKIKDFASEIGYTEKTTQHLNDACDYVSTHYCSDKRLPSFVSQSVIDTCVQVLANITYDLLETNSTVVASYMVRELMKVPKKVVSGSSKVKFSLMSSHDTSVAAVLVFLKDRMGRTKVPGFASHLTMELWKAEGDPDYTIRWVMNGEEVPLREMGDKTQVYFNDFLTAYDDMNKYCRELP